MNPLSACSAGVEILAAAIFASNAAGSLLGSRVAEYRDFAVARAESLPEGSLPANTVTFVCNQDQWREVMGDVASPDWPNGPLMLLVGPLNYEYSCANIELRPKSDSNTVTLRRPSATAPSTRGGCAISIRQTVRGEPIVLKGGWSWDHQIATIQTCGERVPAWLVESLAANAKGKGNEAPLLYVPSHPARDLEGDSKSGKIPKLTEEGKADFHSCRVAYVTFVLEAGASVAEAQALARHTTPGLTLNRYARTRNERLSQVAELVGGKLRSTTGAQPPTRVLSNPSAGSGSGAGIAGSIPAASTPLPPPMPTLTAEQDLISESLTS